MKFKKNIAVGYIFKFNGRMFRKKTIRATPTNEEIVTEIKNPVEITFGMQ